LFWSLCTHSTKKMWAMTITKDGYKVNLVPTPPNTLMIHGRIENAGFMSMMESYPPKWVQCNIDFLQGFTV
jgi:hypothetical protein